MKRSAPCAATGGMHVCELPQGHKGDHRQAISGQCRTTWSFDDRPEPVAVEDKPQLSLFGDLQTDEGGEG
jgi:hypothetical protein